MAKRFPNILYVIQQDNNDGDTLIYAERSPETVLDAVDEKQARVAVYKLAEELDVKQTLEIKPVAGR